MTPSRDPAPRCPSAQPGMAQAEILGVVTPTADGPRLAYVNGHVPAGPDVLALTGDVAPTSVLRLAARCEQGSCTHFTGSRCSLVDRIVARLDEVVDALPACIIRPTCRWYGQVGAPACRRCPQIVTTSSGEGRLAEVAAPVPASARPASHTAPA